jgi:hypothetical protein
LDLLEKHIANQSARRFYLAWEYRATRKLQQKSKTREVVASVLCINVDSDIRRLRFYFMRWVGVSRQRLLQFALDRTELCLESTIQKRKDLKSLRKRYEHWLELYRWRKEQRIDAARTTYLECGLARNTVYKIQLLPLQRRLQDLALSILSHDYENIYLRHLDASWKQFWADVSSLPQINEDVVLMKPCPGTNYPGFKALKDACNDRSEVFAKLEGEIRALQFFNWCESGGSDDELARTMHELRFALDEVKPLLFRFTYDEFVDGLLSPASDNELLGRGPMDQHIVEISDDFIGEIRNIGSSVSGNFTMMQVEVLRRVFIPAIWHIRDALGVVGVDLEYDAEVAHLHQCESEEFTILQHSFKRGASLGEDLRDLQGMISSAVPSNDESISAFVVRQGMVIRRWKTVDSSSLEASICLSALQQCVVAMDYITEGGLIDVTGKTAWLESADEPFGLSRFVSQTEWQIIAEFRENIGLLFSILFPDVQIDMHARRFTPVDPLLLDNALPSESGGNNGPAIDSAMDSVGNNQRLGKRSAEEEVVDGELQGNHNHCMPNDEGHYGGSEQR